MKSYRQGDVLLVEIKSIPQNAVVENLKNRIVLAYGEVTGHAHAIDDLSSVDVFVGDGRMYLQVRNPVSLKHEEHGAIAITPGKYERIIQREYSPEAVRQVAD